MLFLLLLLPFLFVCFLVASLQQIDFCLIALRWTHTLYWVDSFIQINVASIWFFFFFCLYWIIEISIGQCCVSVSFKSKPVGSEYVWAIGKEKFCSEIAFYYLHKSISCTTKKPRKWNMGVKQERSLWTFWPVNRGKTGLPFQTFLTAGNFLLERPEKSRMREQIDAFFTHREESFFFVRRVKKKKLTIGIWSSRLGRVLFLW